MGANVWIFGQCMWGFFNSLTRISVVLYVRLMQNRGDTEARELLAAVGKLADQLMPSTTVTAPCPHCSKSSVQFLAELIRDMGGHPVSYHVQNGSFARFMFNFHNMVNSKLIRQHLEKHGCKDAFDADGVCRVPPKAITFRNYLLRLKLRKEFFNTEDVFLYLHSLRVEYNPALALQYAHVLRCLDGILQLQPRMNKLYGAHPMAMLSQLFTPFAKKILSDSSMLSTRAAFTEWLLNLQLDFMGVHDPARRRATAKHILEETNAIKVAACTDNTCALGSRGQDIAKEPALRPHP